MLGPFKIITREISIPVIQPECVEDSEAPDIHILDVDEIVGVVRRGSEPFYRPGYIRHESAERTAPLPFRRKQKERFDAYYRYSTDPANAPYLDSMSLVAHLTTGQALDQLRGIPSTYLMDGIGCRPSSTNRQNGNIFVTGTTDKDIGDIGEGHSIGLYLKKDRILARWLIGDLPEAFLIGIAPIDSMTRIYGGSLMHFEGTIERIE